MIEPEDPALTAALDTWHAACHSGATNMIGMQQVVKAVREADEHWWGPHAQRLSVSDDMVERAAQAMEVHQVEWIDHEVGWSCGCDERGDLGPLLTLNDANVHIARAALAAALGAPSGEATP